jgi:hypothetical protein
MNFVILFILIALLNGCSSTEDEKNLVMSSSGEYISRLENEFFFVPSSPEPQPLPVYPWEDLNKSVLPKITQEYFRCKGSGLNPIRTTKEGDELKVYADCSGKESHSLPLRNDKEFIYPILIDLSNYLQQKTGKKVVITSGHRCPAHHTYVDPTSANQYSKHMVGAEMAFYIQGMESQPEQVVKYILAFYQDHPNYSGLKEYTEFKCYEKSDTDVSTPPWYNKEIFIKLYQKHEGRDLDNRHPYPYIRVQVRHDRDTQERVVYTWARAHCNYLRK